MDKTMTETLEIQDFLSISHIKWEIKRFNIITGDMGSGKSLCIKLLKFFEDIIPNLLVLPYDKFLKNLDTKAFFTLIIDDFTEIFVLQTSDNNKYPSFKINYEFSYKEQIFDMIITGGEKNISFESLYLKNLLEEWHGYLQKKGIFSPEDVTPDGFDEVKQYLYSDLLRKFGDFFPMATTFIPASRAALAFASSHTDNYLKEFKELIDVLPRFRSSKLEIINTILKAEIEIKDDSLFLKSDDGREVPISKASSGQQEIVYALMLLDKLGNYRYTYGKYHSLFIEEPSAHLFPLEQKQAIELIVQVYNYLKENGNPVRFFITTHSPYILNALNNILRKGALLKKYKARVDKINNTIDIPHLYADEISAFFLTGAGGWDNMLDMDENYLYADKIAEISNAIDGVSVELSELNNELLSEKEQRD